MSIIERATKVLAEIKERRAVIAKATDSPWKAIPGDSYSAYPTVMRGESPHFIILDATEPEGENIDKDTRWYGVDADAVFIADSRNWRDTELACLELAIEALLEINKYDSGNGCCTYGCDTPTVAEMRLTALCNQWEASK